MLKTSIWLQIMNTLASQDEAVLGSVAAEHRVTATSINCSMPTRVIDEIDRIAAAEGLSRSAVVRRAVLHVLRQEVGK